MARYPLRRAFALGCGSHPHRHRRLFRAPRTKAWHCGRNLAAHPRGLAPGRTARQGS
jgi:hypothetical protein